MVIFEFDFSWCGPCKQLGPRLESMVDTRGGKVLLAKVDVDDLGELAMDYGVELIFISVSFSLLAYWLYSINQLPYFFN